MTRIYLDNNATTLIAPVVAERMHELALEGIANPASQHAPGRRALSLLEEAKNSIMECVGAPHSGPNACKIILTSGGTESNNLAIFSAHAHRPGTVIVGATDHPSVIEAGRDASAESRVLPVDQRGQCDVQVLEKWLADASAKDEPVSLVSIMLGNNETGIIQDLKAVTSVCAKYDVPVHSDVVQAVGKMPVDMIDLGLSALTLTAHKIHGPVGIGALIVREDFPIAPSIIGGGQQLGQRAGTEAVIPACGLAAALTSICDAYKAGEFDRVQSLRDQFESALTALGNVKIVGADAPRLPHTSNLSFLNVDRQALQMALDLRGVACSTGSACSSGSGRPSGSLVAMGLDDATTLGSLRFSLSRFSSENDVLEAIKVIEKTLEKTSLAPSKAV